METTCLIFNTKSWMQSTNFSNTVTFLPTMDVSLLFLIICLTILPYYLYNNHGIWIQKQLGLSTWFSYEAFSISLFSVEYPKISQWVNRLSQISIIVEHSSCFFYILVLICHKRDIFIRRQICFMRRLWTEELYLCKGLDVSMIVVLDVFLLDRITFAVSLCLFS